MECLQSLAQESQLAPQSAKGVSFVRNLAYIAGGSVRRQAGPSRCRRPYRRRTSIVAEGRSGIFSTASYKLFRIGFRCHIASQALKVPDGTSPESRNTCTIVPPVKTWTTDPVVGSTSAIASRTSIPVIRLISSRSVWAASRNNRR